MEPSEGVHIKKPSNVKKDLPWYKRRKSIIILILGIMVIIGVLGGTFGSLATNRSITDSSSDNIDSSSEPQAWEMLPSENASVEWDGDCPKSAENCPASFQGIPPLILISMDGFYPAIIKRGLTPTIEKLAKCGSHAPYIFSVFPTKSFPNHVSQVTGVYPIYHGITDNHMFDPSIKGQFKVGTPDSFNPAWWTREPIWVTAEKQGKKTASYFWPGSYVKINGSFPTYFKKEYSMDIPLDDRADQTLKWLDLPPSSRPHFISLYSHQPDHYLHEYGMNAKEIDEPLIEVNRMIERLFAGLQQRNLVGCVNVIIMSDHGMVNANCSRSIDLRNYINVDEAVINTGAVGIVTPKGGKNETAVTEMMSKLRCRSPHMRVYLKEQLPVRVHYSDNPRIEPIFLHLDPGWAVVNKEVQPGEFVCTGGKHGYDDLFPQMKAFFLALGPSFKKNYTIEPFITVELYELFAELIGVIPNSNNGTRGSLHHIMTDPNALPPQVEPESPVVGEVPIEEKEHMNRLSASTCYCTGFEKQMRIQNISGIKNIHLPFGIPYSSEDNNSLRLLYNNNYVTAFSSKYKIPLWSSFTLKTQKKIIMKDDFCWNADVRVPIESSIKCSDYEFVLESNKDIELHPLYPPDFSDDSDFEQARLVTNAILKSKNHSNLIEKPFNEMLNEWVARTGELNVVFGPAFDIFATGLRPSEKELKRTHEGNGSVLIPTHIFAVTTWCSEKVDSLNDCEPLKLRAQGFILPNQPYPINCEDPSDTIFLNSARVVDIETLTGLSFYTKLPIYDAIRLRTMVPERRIM